MRLFYLNMCWSKTFFWQMPFVPIPLAFKFSHLLNAQLIEAGQAGHLRKEDGYGEFPQLLQVLQTLVKAEYS